MSYVPWIVPGKDPMDMEAFRDLSPKAAEAFARRWIDSISDRIKQLEKFIRSTPGFADWRADYSRESLARLGSWALKTIQVVHPDSAEIKRRIAATKGLSRSDKEELREELKSDWTYEDEALGQSIAFDIFTYFGECLRHECAVLKWGRYKDNKINTYNSPCILAPDGHAWFTPVFFGESWLCAILDRTQPPDVFADRFDWNKEELKKLKYIGDHPPPVQVAKRKGKAVTTRCPGCGFGFARVIVKEGVYCNHCGHLQLVQ